MSKKKDKAGGEVIQTKFKLGAVVWPIDLGGKRGRACKCCGFRPVAFAWHVRKPFRVAWINGAISRKGQTVDCHSSDCDRRAEERNCFSTHKAAKAECARRNRSVGARRAAETRKRGKR